MNRALTSIEPALYSKARGLVGLMLGFFYEGAIESTAPSNPIKRTLTQSNQPSIQSTAPSNPSNNPFMPYYEKSLTVSSNNSNIYQDNPMFYQQRPVL